MNKEQREELKRLAAEATPGPWKQGGISEGTKDPHWMREVRFVKDGYPCGLAWIGHGNQSASHKDAAYIAAANPKAITALLSALEAAEAENERLRKAVEDVLAWRVNEPRRGDLRDNDKSRDALSALVKAMEAK